MASGLPSDEVAEDYKASLEDLAMNSRYEISNLTVIAKENTEHAHAISRVLENHIRNAPPARKLPALYVLDSVVKNVGTPYTLFLGRNLYNTFMLAYTQVDSQIRRKLDEMLKTWKEPVPGSLDPRPVFSADVTRPIEMALLRARTSAIQAQNEQDARNRQQALRTRTSTPPVGWNGPPAGYANGRPSSAQFPPPPSSVPPQHNTSNGNGPYYGASQDPRQSYPPQHPQQPTSQPYQTPYQPPYQPPSQSAINVEELNRDIAGLIAASRFEFASSPLDQGIQSKLKALLDLQNILQTQKLPQDQLEQVRNEITKLSTSTPVPKPTPPPVSTPTLPSAPINIQNALQQPGVAALLNSKSLADLLKSTINRQQPTPPPVQSALPFQPPVIRTPPPVQVTPALAPVPAPAVVGNDLLASLRAAGLLGGSLPFNLPSVQTPPNISASLHGVKKIKIDVQLTSASLKIARPHLIPHLYDLKSNQCTTCGRRFFPNQAGKEKKARHLDWHFKTNQRMQEAVKRGQNRSWFVDERDWIKSREVLDEEDLEGANGTSSALLTADAAKKSPEKKWIIAPNDPALRNIPCPICQEKFESTWSEEVQDWIWQDALKVGGRIYHASCHAEATKDGGGTPARDTTPDSVLGKRKAEENDLSGIRSKIKTEPVAS